MDKIIDFDEVYHKYSNLIMKVAVDIVGNYHIAQEISQSTFMEYYMKMSTIEENLIKAWLMTVARNAAIDYVRKAFHKYETESIITSDNVECFITPDYEADIIIDRIAYTDLIYDLLADLGRANEGWLEVVMAVSIGSKSYEEAAQELNITTQVLSARLYRARGWINDHYGDRYENIK